MRGHGIREPLVFLDLLNNANDFRRNLLVQLHIVLKLVDHRARQRFSLNQLTGRVDEQFGGRLAVFGLVAIAQHLGALDALDQHLHGVVGQLQKLKHGRQRTDLVDRVRTWIVVGGVLLGGEQNERVILHHFLEGANGFLAADEERDNHVRKHHDVAQRQHRVCELLAAGRYPDVASGCAHPDRIHASTPGGDHRTPQAEALPASASLARSA